MSALHWAKESNARRAKPPELQRRHPSTAQFAGPAAGRSNRTMGEPVYRRVIVKLSGEALTGSEGFGIHQPTIDRIAGELVAACALGVDLGVVVGGGNIFRGVEVSERGVSRPTGDTMGMLATVMTSLVLEAAIERRGKPARTLSALAMPEVCESYPRARALKHLAKKRVVLFAAGTGNPFFTPDPTAVLRAAELDGDA